MQRFALRQQHQPPITPCFAVSLAAPEQVAFADHADRNPLGIHNRRGADPMSKKKPCNLRHWGIGKTVTGSLVINSWACMERSSSCASETEYAIRRGAHRK
jgi:hypothetical protein